MPLLRKKTLERSTTLPEFLRDDEEVFHCVKTNEIFRNYEEYCERIILVNSMVWSCAMTGRPNLTYAEALQSEEEARDLLKDFPVDLRVPIIYLASLTKRSWLGEMLEDVHTFARDRYFVGETVEACLKEGEPWCECLVIQVFEPSKEALAAYKSESRKQKKNDTTKNLEAAVPGHPASLYSYEVMPLEGEDHDDESVTLNALNVRRKKNLYTRAKNKLFLKQFVEQSKGIYRIKDSVIKKYGIHKVQFRRIFVGNPPDFQASKKNQTKSTTANTTTPSPPKKVKQETMAKYLTKTEKFQGTKQSDAMAKNKEKDKLKKLENKSVKIKKDNPQKNDKNLAEEMKRVAEDLKQKSLLKKKAVAEEKLKEKMKKREEESKFVDYMREWKKVREDLELNDQKMLPEGTTVDTFIPNKNFGKFMEILEFLHTFSAELRVKHFFPSGVTWDIVERALTLREVNGPLADILQVLLTAIFNYVDAELMEKHKNKSKLKLSDELPTDPRKRAVEFATRATKFVLLHYGQDLSNTRLDAVTLSEVLRLHLLTSGAKCCTEGGARWRYQQRGGYSSQDDPGLELRLSHPHILRALSRFHVCELPLDDILKIIDCLINQLLTFVNIRDITEDRIEKAIKARFDLRKLQMEHAKRQKTYQMKRLKITTIENSDKLEDGTTVVTIVDKAAQEKLLLDLETEYNKFLNDYKKQYQDLMQVQFAYQMYLGSDRAHRRYWLFESVPGLFVEHDEQQAGSCLFDIVPQYMSLTTTDNTEYTKQVRLLFDEQQLGSDKENNVSSVNAKKVVEKCISLPAAENFQRSKDLLMCTANNDLCLVHGNNGPVWSFYHAVEDIDKLISTLNVRGIRESSLKSTLEQNRDLIGYHIENKVPLERLNKNINDIPEIKKRTLKKYNESNTNLNFPAGTDPNVILDATLREYILDLEQNIFKGCLGSLKVKDRDTWRKAVEKSSYDMQCDEIYWGPEKIYSEKKGIKSITNGFVKVNGHTEDISKDKIGGSDNESVEDDDDDEPDNDKFEDPVELLEDYSDFKCKDTDESCKNMTESPDIQKKIYTLACALLQVEQAVANRFFKAPFGYKSQKSSLESTIRKMERKALRLLGRWEVSLMNSKSFAQVFLHYNCLEDSIIWTQSAAGARCRICRRGGDAENMLLCDSCNKGQHLYCLRPSLEKIPEGDWFCQFCRPAEPTPLETKRKRRRIFNYDNEDETKSESAESAEESADEENDEQDSEEVEQVSDVESDEEIKSKSSKSSSSEVVDICKVCCSGGELIGCDVCNVTYHFECVQPPLKRAPRGKWKCHECNPRKKREREATREYVNHHEPRRCATQSRCRILEFTRSLRRGSVDDETDASEEAPTRRTLENGRRSRRNIEDDGDLPLHNVELHELLGDITKHKDSWPFMRPVTKQDVPDYFDIIKNPMDFSKIKSKLNLGEYTSDKEIFSDVKLVFQNCDTYNNSTSSVFKAGVRLEKFVNKRCKELHLNIPDNTNEPDAKKQRTTL